MKRKNGGVVLYSHNSFPVTASEQFDDDIFQTLFCTSPPSKHVLLLYIGHLMPQEASLPLF